MSSGLNVNDILTKHGQAGASSAATAPPVTLTFTDTFANIAGTVFDTPDASDVTGNKYLLQRLKPGVSYKLTFSIYTETSQGSGNFTIRAENLKPSGVTGPALGTSSTTANYFLDGTDIAFKTALDDGTNVTQTGFTRHDTAIENYRIKTTAGYTEFVSDPTFYDLTPAGQPVSGFAVPPDPHQYDGYLFLFKYPDVDNTNVALTTALRTNSYVGYDPFEENPKTKGFKRISDISSARLAGVTQSAGLSSSDFDVGGTFGPLDKDQQYVVGLVLHDKTSDYIPYRYHEGQQVIKWYSFILSEAGNWQIYLRQFMTLNPEVDGLHPSTVAGIHIDAISTVGSFNSDDNIRIVMTATPFAPTS